jgi:CRP-like cAMP-binding protein
MKKAEPTLWPHQIDTPKFLAQVGAGLSTSHYKKNQNIFVQGDAADSVYFIHEGEIKGTVTSDHGKEAVVGILGSVLNKDSITG